MFEKIISIEEGSFNKQDGTNWQGEPYFTGYDGYIITTNKQTIKVGISNDQSCCENWGYLTTNDNLSEFVGATLVSIATVDTALNVKAIKEADLYEPNMMFVNFSTDRGTMQLVAYNDHNGYYGHAAVVISETFNHEETL